MLMPPTTFVTISRATQTDAYGDPQDIDSTPLYTDVPAIISDPVTTTQDPATGTPRQVNAMQIILRRGTDVRDDDRITDQQTGIVYNVTSVRVLPAYGIPSDIWCTVQTVGG